MNVHLLSGNIARIFETRQFKSGTQYKHFVVACDGETKDSEADYIEVRITGKAVPAFEKWATVGRLVEVNGRRISKFVDGKKIDYTRAEGYKWLSAPKKAKEVEVEEEEEDTCEEEETPAPVKATKAPAKTAKAAPKRAPKDEVEF